MESFDDELVEYARRADFFSHESLERIRLLKESEQVESMAGEIMGRHFRGKKILRPIPPKVLAYIQQHGKIWGGFE
jgi:nicotinic acid mononucleotide adenylyltransferase